LLVSKYGVDVVAKFIVLAVVVILGMFALVSQEMARYVIVGLVAVVTGFVLNFFRDPERTPPRGGNIVVAPADGKVVLIKEVFETEYLNSRAVQVSIFMSPLNVHVNRFPISGTVGFFKYIKGDYIVAFEDKSSEQNERTLIGVEDEGYKVLFKQIAGAVARRIVANVSIGQSVTIGERFGMIKFGSRVDVIMPESTVVKVKLGDRVVAGETVLASYGSVALSSMEQDISAYSHSRNIL
jgi:phosphatidylserine decarboxylase